jgi:hypothetical protein
MPQIATSTLHRLARNIINAAAAHAENTGEDHLPGDCEDIIRLLLEYLTPQQLFEFVQLFDPEDPDDTPGILAMDRPALAQLCRKIEKETKTTAWTNNSFQFPRVIVEAMAAGAFTEEILTKMADSMDLERSELEELISRAGPEFEGIKELLKTRVCLETQTATPGLMRGTSK